MAGCNVVMTRAYDFGHYKEYCLSCFQNPKYWKAIHTVKDRKDSVSG